MAERFGAHTVMRHLHLDCDHLCLWCLDITICYYFAIYLLFSEFTVRIH